MCLYAIFVLLFVSLFLGIVAVYLSACVCVVSVCVCLAGWLAGGAIALLVRESSYGVFASETLKGHRFKAQ